MNDYIETRVQAKPCTETVTDVLAALLANVGYESFVPDEEGLTAYIRSESFEESTVKALLESFPLPDTALEASHTLVEGRDWNSEWERNYFQPIVVGNECVIHSSFHTGYPECRYDIVIDPKMAFGTGHHSTTSLMLRRLLEQNPEGKKVLDMGTGTGILAILAAMRGAEDVTAVEIDDFAAVNAAENLRLNGAERVKLINGDASAIASLRGVEILLANINLNVIMGDMEAYVATLADGADVYFSGFYTGDVASLEAKARESGLEKVDVREDKDWACVHFRKPRQ